ncbi:MAG: pentapeptide repeat-containing protein [Pegethrix bostrychoides GSE-TBD4-15B]|jgi:uncharacterized protein YjbI with pentapeptide repeats|uniref:Pentapeptide repeat-containing protein n=1 Tax=Pegethrix bostrychoides GSE-TBD4-15B TaxID=2839662 RepID=A0A951PEE0_9CYAN|nr:pentapeptide repeat-containing protein [Pegethrix bostrychoides GSE-TBD4-15B]
MTMQIWTLFQAELQQLRSGAAPLITPQITRSDALWNSLEQGSSLFAALTLPISELLACGQPFQPLVTVFLRQQPQVTLTQAVGLMAQAVYLDRIFAALPLWPLESADLSEPESSAEHRPTLEPLPALDSRQVLVDFPNSELAARFNRHFASWLQQNGVPPAELRQAVSQIAQETSSRLLPALEAVGASMRWLACYHETELSRIERRHSIEAYLDDQIAARPTELVFNESFSLREIYVPLQAQPLNRDGEPNLDQPPVDLADWVRTQLSRDSAEVMLLQAGFGRGKTSFCRIFADWVRQQEYPRWTPILISLQDLHWAGDSVEAFLQQAMPTPLRDDPDWLTQPQSRFLFILDGFSELHLEAAHSLEQFFQQVGRFQESCASHPGMGHRLILTGRSLMIQNLGRLLPPNLARVEILPFNDALQTQWLTQWERLTQWGKLTQWERPTQTEASGLKQILQTLDLPESSQDLPREPLMLYFFAAMYRDGGLKLDALSQTSGDRAKFLLYQQIFYWALTQQQPGLLNRALSPAEIETLRRLLAEAGLWTVQTGLESVPLESLGLRLQAVEGTGALIAEIETQLQQPLTNALVTIYSCEGKSYLRFNHNSFGKLFCSRCLHESLEDWTVSFRHRQRQELLVSPESLPWQIYDLLGYGGLSPEMTEYLMVLLNANPDVDLVLLFQRLEKFYLSWANGEFVDAPPENLAQKAMRLLGQRSRQLGQRQVDVYAGLNAMILLLQLYGYALAHQSLQGQITFHPCGRQGMPEFRPQRLLQIIGYSHCVSPHAFRVIVGPYLSSANLSGVTLTGVNLSGVNLSNADLRCANLNGANLRGANLSRANLVGANLAGADLSNADLRGANLIGADLRGADLSNASLSGADLSGANLIGASLSLADLRDVDLSGAYLRGASLQGATLSRAYLIGASLSGANLSSADLEQVDLSGANLHGANLSEVNLRGADLSNADLIGTDLSDSVLCGANLQGASLNSAELTGADLCGADLDSASFIGADLSDQITGDVKWSERTRWQNVRGLDAAINVPAALKQQLGLPDSVPEQVGS